MRRAAAAALALAAVVLGPAPATAGEGAERAAGWQAFAGTWSAVGVRHTVPTGGEHPAVIARVRGAILVSGAEGLGAGFEAEAIYFDDGRGSGTGRAVWTDVRGERIFSEFKGEPSRTGRLIVGTFTGGTGRYAGLEGEYSLTWRYVVEAEAGEIQSRADDLKGRFRFPGAPR